jgi:aryl hydrocarbon receptor nuclear translocator-like protein 1
MRSLVVFLANGREMQRMINTHIEASKIGRQISDEVLEFQRRMGDFSSGILMHVYIKRISLTNCLITDSSPDIDPTLAQAVPILTENPLLSSSDSSNDRQSSDSASTSQASTTPRINGTLPSYNHVRNNIIAGPENGKHRH